MVISQNGLVHYFFDYFCFNLFVLILKDNELSGSLKMLEIKVDGIENFAASTTMTREKPTTTTTATTSVVGEYPLDLSIHKN